MQSSQSIIDDDDDDYDDDYGQVNSSHTLLRMYLFIHVGI